MAPLKELLIYWNLLILVYIGLACLSGKPMHLSMLLASILGITIGYFINTWIRKK